MDGVREDAMRVIGWVEGDEVELVIAEEARGFFTRSGNVGEVVVFDVVRFQERREEEVEKRAKKREKRVRQRERRERVEGRAEQGGQELESVGGAED